MYFSDVFSTDVSSDGSNTSFTRHACTANAPFEEPLSKDGMMHVPTVSHKMNTYASELTVPYVFIENSNEDEMMRSSGISGV